MGRYFGIHHECPDDGAEGWAGSKTKKVQKGSGTGVGTCPYTCTRTLHPLVYPSAHLHIDP
jgi:hypothetical protein